MKNGCGQMMHAAVRGGKVERERETEKERGEGRNIERNGGDGGVYSTRTQHSSVTSTLLQLSVLLFQEEEEEEKAYALTRGT